MIKKKFEKEENVPVEGYVDDLLERLLHIEDKIKTLLENGESSAKSLLKKEEP